MSSTRAPRVGSVRILDPQGLFDKCDERVNAHTGHWVEVTQPFGCPRNGTMGHCYVDCISCGQAKAKLLGLGEEAKSRIFIGLVLLSSLVKLDEPVEVLEIIGTRPYIKYRVRTADGGERVTKTNCDHLMEGTL